MCTPRAATSNERDEAGEEDGREGGGGAARAGLKVLNVSQNMLEDGGCKIVFEAVAKCSSLEVGGGWGG